MPDEAITIMSVYCTVYRLIAYTYPKVLLVLIGMVFLRILHIFSDVVFHPG